jgi:hypothetical protein
MRGWGGRIRTRICRTTSSLDQHRPPPSNDLFPNVWSDIVSNIPSCYLKALAGTQPGHQFGEQCEVLRNTGAPWGSATF